MNYELKPLQEKEHLIFFELIDKNRARLKMYFPNTIQEVQNVEDAKKQLKRSDQMRIDKERYLFGIFNEGNLIGYVNVKNVDWQNSKCEIGYFIDEGFEGKGIMTRQIKNIIKYCFDTLGMMKIFLRIGKENIGSKVLAEKNGFEKEGVLRNEFRLGNGKFIDLEYYGILNQNF